MLSDCRFLFLYPSRMSEHPSLQLPLTLKKAVKGARRKCLPWVCFSFCTRLCPCNHSVSARPHSPFCPQYKPLSVHTILVHATYMPTIAAVLYLFRKIIKIGMALWNYRQPLKIYEFSRPWNDNTERWPFRFFQRVAEAFVPELTKATLGRGAHAWKTEICRFALRSALRMCERHEAKKSFSEVSGRERCICKAASQIDLRNQGAICKKVSCSREGMAKSVGRTHEKLSPVKRRHFQMFKKAFHEKWPFVTIDKKGDSCLSSEVRSTVVKWLDWQTIERDRQKQHSQLRGICKVNYPMSFP